MARHTFANVGRGAPEAQRAAYGRVAKLGGLAHSYAEVGESDGAVDERAALHKAYASRRGWIPPIAVSSHVPVIVRSSSLWEVVEIERIRAARGRESVGPARLLVVVRLRHRLTGRRRTLVNTHFHAGAFNGAVNREEAFRRRSWAAHWRILKAVVASEAASGADVVVTGDFNRQGRFPELHPREVLAHKHATDRIVAVPAAGRKAVVSRRSSAPVGVDFHTAISASIRFARA